MDELDDLQVLNDGHVHKKTVEDLLVGLEVVVVDLDHQKADCQLQLYLEFLAVDLLLLAHQKVAFDNDEGLDHVALHPLQMEPHEL